MELIKNLFKRTVLIIILISTLITFLATPASYAQLELEDDEFYYAGTTEGAYVASFDIFSWLLNNIGDIADWLLGIITMGFRMVFVGWTALLEKALTWALESTTGVSASGALIESSTDMSSISDPSSNITVEAIVYNKVAGLNIDFFELDFDRGITGTGKKLVCEKCEMVVAGTAEEEGCISITEAEAIKSDAENIKQQIVNGSYDFGQHCTCGCNGCDECSKYVKQLVADKPIVIKIRELVATWYSIIRFLAMAAMLVILIAIGIKMALSTIASDKAVYKRMLVDWVVGVIILFVIHYFMIFCIYMNGIIVKTIEESAQSINKVQMQEMMGEETEVSNAELEIKVYEEVRTRAYDARLINGMTGMIMYMTLVFFAFKYTIIYLKRYLTILVLTLMGPGVGVAYALQKALSGKSSALTTWMTEYIMNIIIQIIHALIYAIFISQAMVLSLKSVAGMVLALILMNYTTKADQLFKKIFKFGGADSLAGHTAGAMESTLQGIQSAKAMATGAKPLAKALTNTPYAKAIKGVGKLALAGAATGINAGANLLDRLSGESEAEKYDSEMDKEMNSVMQSEKQQAGENPEDYLNRVRDMARDNIAKSGKFKNMVALDAGREKLEAQVSASRDALEEAQKRLKGDKSAAGLKEISEKRDDLAAAADRLKRYDKKTTPTAGKIALGHLRRAVEVENQFKLRKSSGKNDRRLALDNIMAIHDGVFGSLHFNKNTWKFEREKNAVFNQFSPSNYFQMNDQDKKMFKQHVLTPIASGLGGMVSMFVGMGTIVANPKVGMGLLATGVSLTGKTFRKPTNINSYKGTYTFSRFGLSTMNTIKNSAIAQARREQRGLIASSLDSRKPTFKEKLKNGDIKAITLGVAISPVAIPTLIATKIVAHPIESTKSVANAISHPKNSFQKARAYGGKVWKSTVKTTKDVGHAITHPGETTTRAIKGVGNLAKSGAYATANIAIETVKAPKNIVRSVINNTSLAEHEEAMNRYNALEQEKRIKEFKKEADKLISIQAAAEVAALEKDAEDKLLTELYKDAGYEYDKKTGAITPIGSSSNGTKKANKETDVDVSVLQDRVNHTKITEADANFIDNEIEEIVAQISLGKEIDIDDKAVQAEIVKKLGDKLIKAGLLKEGQKVEDIFKTGNKGLKSVIKKKARRTNSSVKDANKKLESFLSKEEAAQVSNIVSQEIQNQMANGDKTVTIPLESVLSKLNPSRDGSSAVSTSDGSMGVTMSGDGSRKVKGDKAPQVTEEQRVSAISQYIQSITPVSAPEPKQTTVDKDTVRSVTRKVKEEKRRMQKLTAAVMGIELDGEKPPVQEEGQDSVLNQLLQGKTEISTGSDGTVKMTEAGANATTAIVKKLLEITEANKVAVQELDVKKGTKGYAKAKNKKSELKIEISKLDKEIQQIEMGILPKDETGVEVPKEKALAKAERKKVTLEDQKKKVEREQTLAGPIYDITDLIRNQMGRR